MALPNYVGFLLPRPFLSHHEMSMRFSGDTNQYILGQQLLANMDFSGPITLLRLLEQPTCPSY